MGWYCKRDKIYERIRGVVERVKKDDKAGKYEKQTGSNSKIVIPGARGRQVTDPVKKVSI